MEPHKLAGVGVLTCLLNVIKQNKCQGLFPRTAHICRARNHKVSFSCTTWWPPVGGLDGLFTVGSPSHTQTPLVPRPRLLSLLLGDISSVPSASTSSCSVLMVCPVLPSHSALVTPPWSLPCPRSFQHLPLPWHHQTSSLQGYVRALQRPCRCPFARYCLLCLE